MTSLWSISLHLSPLPPALGLSETGVGIPGIYLVS